LIRTGATNKRRCNYVYVNASAPYVIKGDALTVSNLQYCEKKRCYLNSSNMDWLESRSLIIHCRQDYIFLLSLQEDRMEGKEIRIKKNVNYKLYAISYTRCPVNHRNTDKAKVLQENAYHKYNISNCSKFIRE